MGQVFYDMGLLATNQVYECTTTDLIGDNYERTGPKTQKVFQRALGKVLFIDEAYWFNNPDSGYGKEAVDEMLNLLTMDAYRNKTMTVLAGYDKGINALLQLNPGLGSRFAETVQFPSLTPAQCHELLAQHLGAHKKLDARVLARPELAERLRASFKRLAALPDWGNARDVDTLAKAVLGRFLRQKEPGLAIEEDTVEAEVEAMIAEREHRAGTSDSSSASHMYLWLRSQDSA